MTVLIRLATYMSILISVISLAWGYSQRGFSSLVPWIMLFGVIWLLAQSQLWWWFAGLGLIVVILAAAFGMLLGGVPGWMISAGIFALIAWALSEFQRDTGFKTRTNELRAMERRHVARLTLLALGGLLLASIMMFLIRAPFTREWFILFGSVLFLGLIQLVLWFRNR